jgi:hypothetical protein
MNAQEPSKPETRDDRSDAQQSLDGEQLAAPTAQEVSTTRFDDIVREAIEGVGGTTHSGSLSGIACTDDTIAAYLATGVLPSRVPGNRSDKQCDPVPPPPAAQAAAASTLSTGGDVRAELQELIGPR